jgi:predicted ATPase
LPSPATSLVGRRLEIAAVEAMLRRDDVRLVTLTGTGGTGKTRLAIAVAQALAPELRDGAVFVDLSSVTDAELVLPTVAHALELPSADDALAALRDSSLLFVLDNLEQLGASVQPVAALLAAAPRLRVLATSRTPLRLSGEHEYPVPPLPVPSGAQAFEHLVENDAVRLLAARAQAANPSFALTDENISDVAAICTRLDGLPLAIELAAARLRALTPAEVERRLGAALTLLVEGARDLPERQRTLRATLDWSYGLLAEPERELLARLAVFAGGCSLADAEAVLGDDIALPLSTLVDASLLVAATSGSRCSRRSASTGSRGCTPPAKRTSTGGGMRRTSSRWPSRRGAASSKAGSERPQDSLSSTPSRRTCTPRFPWPSSPATSTPRCASRARSAGTGSSAGA